MTFEELQRAFELHTGTSGDIDAAELALWFNEAQLDLALELGNTVKQVYTGVEAGAEYNLPADFLKLISVGSDYNITPDRKIIFYLSGTVALYYRKRPRVFTGDNAGYLSELDETLHDLLPLWAAARYWDRESEGDYEESGHGNKWMNYYLKGKEQRRKLLQQLSASSCWVVE